MRHEPDYAANRPRSQAGTTIIRRVGALFMGERLLRNGSKIPLRWVRQPTARHRRRLCGSWRFNCGTFQKPALGKAELRIGSSRTDSHCGAAVWPQVVMRLPAEGIGLCDFDACRCRGWFAGVLPSQIFRPNSLNFFKASAFPRASSTGLWVCLVTRYFFHSVALDASLTRPA